MGCHLHAGNLDALFINVRGAWRGGEVVRGPPQHRGIVRDIATSPGLDPGGDEQAGVELVSGFPFKCSFRRAEQAKKTSLLY